MTTRTAAKKNRWSHEVTENSDALDLEEHVFTWSSPRRIALSLKHSAEASTRGKAGSFQSAMSMLNFHIHRGGKNISPSQKKVLTRAKEELRKLFEKDS